MQRAVITIGLICLSLLGRTTAPQESSDLAVGEWSAPVADHRGYALQGRLVLTQRPLEEARREVVVYVELRDANDFVNGTMRLFCDFSRDNTSGTGLTCELRDERNQPVTPTMPPFGGRVPASEWITLPTDATIRLRSTPFGLNHANALTISPHLSQVWIIPDEDHRPFKLSGTFTIDPAEGRGTVQDPHIWRGKLELPAVSIVNTGPLPKKKS